MVFLIIGRKLSYSKKNRIYIAQKFFRATAKQQYNYEGKWVGIGPEKCTDPKRLREAITKKPDEFIEEISINTFQGETSTFTADDNLNSFLKPIGNVQLYFVY